MFEGQFPGTTLVFFLDLKKNVCTDEMFFYCGIKVVSLSVLSVASFFVRDSRDSSSLA